MLYLSISYEVWNLRCDNESVQSLDDKGKKSSLEFIQILHKGQARIPFVKLVYLVYIASVTLLYNDANFIHKPLSTLYNLVQLVQLSYIVSTNVLYIDENINKYYMKCLLICVSNNSCGLVWEKNGKWKKPRKPLKTFRDLCAHMFEKW